MPPRSPAPPPPPPYDGPRAPIGVIGGSGFYSLLETSGQVVIDTPYGPPSDPLVIGTVGDRSVAFVPRHGADHRHPPHLVPYRANLWALRAVGVRQVLAPCAVGSLRPDAGPGTLVLPDQIVDRTWGREHTFVDGHEGVAHVSFSDPYCPVGRRAVLDTAGGRGSQLRDGGTLVVVNGPRFSSRAESRWHAAAGWSIVGMTTMPEAALAREMALCYTTIALVTDLDAGVEGEHGVTQQEVFRVFADNVAALRELLVRVAGRLPLERDGCDCAGVHEGMTLPFALP